MINLVRCTSENNDFQNLVILLDMDLNSRYGKIQDQYNQYNKIEGIKNVIVAYDAQTPVGCGCFKLYSNDSVEMKRMFVKPENRGQGISKSILSELEKWAKEEGFKYSILETGIKQFEACGLYKKFGYEIIENYGQYIDMPHSLCMKKSL